MKSHNRSRGRAFTRAPLPMALVTALLRLALGAGAAHADILVQQGRVEPTRGESGVAAAYFELRNDTVHELELLKVDSPRAASVELKQRSYDAQNRPHVWPVARLEIPPGGRVRFHADGRFFRLVGLDGRLVAGERVPLVLYFEDEKPVTVQLVVVTP